ncbi:divergent polysaccharide deacetylase family protein [Caldovatus aquaticus]|uniref:Divergent polysaccharide deacetylase family protein n=1 Tax=Caldovatus aquaticus TaxID=2865671 RepID=A0ABS7F069_9PROT|nr:divergent polysaccharide deacetylase family protein [Caldovatus aquaticus]MBW8269030.1 divergent polysaccharide deacetylase family protein [Caldovatus aquaticus]
MLAGSGPRPIPPPDPALLEERPGGVRLPRIAPDGRTAFRAYAQAGFDRADTRPRVAVVLAGIGLSASDTGEAIRRLPPAVTLALNPYAPRLDPVAERARERGMETLVAVPMESAGYPLADPGDKALLTGLSLAENLNRLDWALARAAGYVGVLGGLGPLRGERFAQLADLLGPVQDVLCARGLLYVDSRPGAPHPARAWGRAVDVVLDEPATRGEIERRLAELERLARENGSALGLAGDPAPVVVERLAAWAAGLEARGLVLAPLTAVIRRPERARCAGGGPPVAAGFPVPAPAPPPASPSPR